MYLGTYLYFSIFNYGKTIIKVIDRIPTDYSTQNNNIGNRPLAYIRSWGGLMKNVELSSED